MQFVARACKVRCTRKTVKKKKRKKTLVACTRAYNAKCTVQNANFGNPSLTSYTKIDRLSPARPYHTQCKTRRHRTVYNNCNRRVGWRFQRFFKFFLFHPIIRLVHTTHDSPTPNTVETTRRARIIRVLSRRLYDAPYCSIGGFVWKKNIFRSPGFEKQTFDETRTAAHTSHSLLSGRTFVSKYILFSFAIRSSAVERNRLRFWPEWIGVRVRRIRLCTPSPEKWTRTTTTTAAMKR